MNDQPDQQNDNNDKPSTTVRMKKNLARRYSSEKRFRWYGILAIAASVGFLMILFSSIISNGWRAFKQTEIMLPIYYDPALLGDPSQGGQGYENGNYAGLIKNSLAKMFPDVSNRRQKRELYQLVSSGAQYQLRDRVLANPSLAGQTENIWLLADDEVDLFMKEPQSRVLPESDRRFKDHQIVWIDKLKEEKRIKFSFNSIIFKNGDSREPELSGVWGATVGSFYTLMVTLLLSFPIGVAAAIYLEEFAPRNRITDFIEININNLAAVPSIVFGLLGLAVFIGFFGLPRSAPVVGGLVLTLMTLPTIIISSRAAISAVPPSIREAALGLGASKMQMVLHHVVPLAMPGMLTGAIIGMSGALGETAPLLMIGMVAFVVDIPGGPLDPATALPVQIYLWADSPERAFVERTSAAIMLLLLFLIAMNGLAIFLRKKFEHRWK